MHRQVACFTCRQRVHPSALIQPLVPLGLHISLSMVRAKIIICFKSHMPSARNDRIKAHLFVAALH